MECASLKVPEWKFPICGSGMRKSNPGQITFLFRLFKAIKEHVHFYSICVQL